MSDVYLAYDERLQHEVAIKLVSNDQSESTQRLQHEIHTLRNLSHDHIVPILDHGEDEGYHYLVMPYVQQGTLRDRIARGRLTPEEAGSILVQVTSALHCAHQQGIVHRDITPSNMLLAGMTPQHVYLADFNLAKATGKGSDLTQTGIVLGTPAYMAPELIEKPASVSSDIYALGVVLYYMLTGQVPFSGSSHLGVFWKHVHEVPVSPSALNPAIPAPVEQVILRALHKDPQHRFPSAEALAQAYMHALLASHIYTVAHPVVHPFEPTMIQRACKKSELSLLPALVQQRSPLPWWQHPHYDFQKAFVSLALVTLLMLALPLGFFLSRALAPLPLASKASVAGVLQQASLASTPQTIPAVHPPGGNQAPPRPWLLQRAASIATQPGHRDEPQGFSGQKSNSAKPVLLSSFLHTAVTNVVAGFGGNTTPPYTTSSFSLHEHKNPHSDNGKGNWNGKGKNEGHGKEKGKGNGKGR
jgi:serine/threonine protein kinase